VYTLFARLNYLSLYRFFLGPSWLATRAMAITLWPTPTVCKRQQLVRRIPWTGLSTRLLLAIECSSRVPADALCMVCGTQPSQLLLLFSVSYHRFQSLPIVTMRCLYLYFLTSHRNWNPFGHFNPHIILVNWWFSCLQPRRDMTRKETFM